MALTGEQMVEVAVLAAQAYVEAKDTKGWIPTHDGARTKDGAINDPYIRDNDLCGLLPKPYLVWFETKGAANAWCDRVGAVPLACSYGEAKRIAASRRVDLLES